MVCSAIQPSLGGLRPASASDLPTETSELSGRADRATVDHRRPLQRPQLSRNHPRGNEKILHTDRHKRKQLSVFIT